VRFTYDNNYFNSLYQGIPVRGYTDMVARMLDGADVRLNEDYLADRKSFDALADRVVYTGPLDAFFDHRLGLLQYRSVRFEDERLKTANYQGNAVVNYTDREVPFTRIIEHKWFEFGKDEDGNDLPTTIISREYPAEWKPGDEPYYPINDKRNNDLADAYRKMAGDEERVIFGGRLGDYRYYDMDVVIEQALRRCSEVL